jgi:uncharacterized protein YggE
MFASRLPALGAAPVLALALSLCFAPRYAAAQGAPHLSVTGVGTITREPDRATLAVTIVTSNDVASTSSSQNNTTYNALLARLRGIGIAQSAVRTTNYAITFVPKPTEAATYKPAHTGYVVTRSLAITIDDLSLVGRATDAAVSAGVEQIDGVSFGLRDERSAYGSALAAAVRDAALQAKALADAAHVRLGAVRTMTTGSPQQAPVPLRALAVAAPNVPTEIPPSQIEVHATVIVTYMLLPGR